VGAAAAVQPELGVGSPGHRYRDTAEGNLKSELLRKRLGLGPATGFQVSEDSESGPPVASSLTLTVGWDHDAKAPGGSP
jgi:hypothetical protein